MRGIGLRITMIMSASLLVLMLALGALYWAQHRGDRAAFRLPLPRQVGAIADLVERTPPAQLGSLLEAVNSDNLSVAVEATPPSSAGTVPAPGLAWVLQRYVNSSGDRKIVAMFPEQPDRQTIGFQQDAESGEAVGTTLPLRLVVTLKDGRSLVLETKNSGIRRVRGFRLVLLLLLLAILLSSSTLWYMRRQVGPIERLAAEVERVGPDLPATGPGIAALAKQGGRETRQLAAAIGRMQERIRGLLAARSRMLAAIGHDFGTYLTRLRLRTEFIADPEQRAAAIRDIENMDALITGTMTLAQSDQNAEPRSAVDLVALARRHAEGFAASGEAVRFLAEAGAIHAAVQPVAFGRAVTNLISNAIRYGKEAEVAVRREGKDAVILVEDRGPGIPESEREAVLEPFHRRDAARNLDQAGFGLGLAIVADILRRNEAGLQFADREGGGLRVVVRMKAVAAPAAAAVA
jgi:signal transduction histidine kinase